MSRVTWRWLACGAVILCAIGSAAVLHAQLEIGTWVRTDMPNGKMTMTVQACCNGGRRLVYHVETKGQPFEMTVESGLDGKDAPLLIGGKPSGQTMAITRIDALHATSVQKMNGQPMSTSKATLSADGKTLTIEDEITEPGGKTGKVTEKWVKQ